MNYKKIIKKIILIIISILAIAACSSKTEAQLNENEKMQIYDIRYLINDDGKYMMENIIIETNLLNSEMKFESQNNGEDNSKNAKSPVSGAKVIEYSYSNIAPVSYEEDAKIFEYSSSILLLNNDKKLASIDKINLSINSNMTSKKLDLNKLSDIKNIISNYMSSDYNEWTEAQYTYNFASYSQYGIDYLSENIASINNYNYLYTGGAHGMYGTMHEVYTLDNGEKLKIDDILINVNDLSLLNKVRQKLLSMANEDEGISYFNLDELSLQDNNFYITSNDLVFTWGIYEIAPYSMGESEVSFSKDEIMPYLKDEYKNIFD